ncbi:ACP phosphodiesterase [Aliagarivorans marinus]|uniref:acyl carrier protein phosphodiesterase n=1 Tax=Aliagarivorans marinus TaxID=561965 RepID=UPI000429233B|nr:ACP phosphodiesterase [Aliagarivorans marinus]
MNYLAHLHIAAHTHTSLVGAFMGDFVKGRAWQQLPTELAQGVRLHRHVDSWIDQRYLDAQLPQLFPASLRRFSTIALDIYLDYLLCTHWPRFHPQALNAFIDESYAQLASATLEGRALYVRDALVEGDWLGYYRIQANMESVLRGVSSRMRRGFDAAGMYQALVDQHTQIESFFTHHYPLLLEDCRQYLDDE